MTASEADPAVTDWRKVIEAQEMSTSAHLRMQLAAALHDAEHVAQERDFAKLELTRARAALAASQSDLTAALAEREDGE